MPATMLPGAADAASNTFLDDIWIGHDMQCQLPVIINGATARRNCRRTTVLERGIRGKMSGIVTTDSSPDP
jgi:hypothetical protein